MPSSLRAAAIAAAMFVTTPAAPGEPDPALAAVAARATATLVAKHGGQQRARVERGVGQVLRAWQASDGGPAALQSFLEAQFVAPPGDVDALLGRLEDALEALDGATVEQNRALSRHADLDLGPMLPIDRLLATYDAGAHRLDDLFGTQVAFVALLNFPLTTLDERLRDGAGWTRRQWAEARLAGRFALRIPASVAQQVKRASAAAELYVAAYDVHAHHLLVAGARPFPRGMRLLSHWNLRDQIKAEYAAPDGLARQRALAQVMDRIVTQTVPRAAIGDPRVDWDPFSNAVSPAPAATIESGASPLARVDAAREPDTRYAHLLETFRAARAVDACSPIAPTHMARKFELERELPEARVTGMLQEIVTSPLLPRIARIIEARLGRKLEPFDVWYDGFRPRSRASEGELDALVRRRYPTVASFQADLPQVLARLGFEPDRARWLGEHIVVDPARGSGHALGADRRGDLPHLRTRFGKGGMDYKGFDIAIHELGHNVEQVFSLYEVDRNLLRGVPNTAFTEALAFVFQARALAVLGLPGPTEDDRRLLALNDLWATYEIAGVALVDTGVWRWMYAHPEATPAELREATLSIAREVWNRYYEPVVGGRDVALLGIYSHMIADALYLPDYPIGHLIAAQIEQHLRTAPRLGVEFERIARQGAVTPDLWMRRATGAPVGTAALLSAAQRALDEEERRATALPH